MIARLIEVILPCIIGIMVHKREKLTTKEQKAQKRFSESLEISRRKTKKPVIVAMVGLVGSGKSTVAQAISEMIGGTIIEGDQIRVYLRKENEEYEGTRKIAENVALEIIKEGDNAILDSDHIDPKKRASLREKAKSAKVRLVFIRTLCDHDIMFGRAITKRFPATENDFFGGAGLESSWKNSETAGTVVKVREIWRRTPYHYRWKNKVGGKWIPKKLSKLPFKILAEVNTSDPKWKEKLQQTVSKL